MFVFITFKITLMFVPTFFEGVPSETSVGASVSTAVCHYSTIHHMICQTLSTHRAGFTVSAVAPCRGGHLLTFLNSVIVSGDLLSYARHTLV